MELVRTILADRRFHRLAWLGVVLGIGLLVLAWRLGVDWEALRDGWLAAEGFLRDRPWWFFAALVVLPGFPVPMTAMLVLAGTMWRDQPAVACGIALSAMVLNMSWTYWAAAGPARRLVEKLLDWGRLPVPKLPKNDQLRVLLILRLTPGIPLFFQNYLLGFLQVPFRLYLPVSMGISGMIACGVVLGGAGVAGGNFIPILSGLGLIVAGVIVVKWARARVLGM
jgi:uncharacterized membrane protein YdjX (TVP38/TMEM64 family)